MEYDGTLCLTDDEVINYVEGRYPHLNPAIDAHQANCTTCARRINEEREFMERSAASAVRNMDLEDELDEKYPGWR